MNIPVALLIFNRPDKTEKVLEVIRQVKPDKLLIVADGPREDHSDDVERCKAARAVIDSVDWNCQVLKNYSDVNLGCGKRPATGITWIFEQVEEAIILEDDCLPHPDFFYFCEIMLERYRNDSRVMMISGTNFLGEWKSDIQSYHFSYMGGIWGWASWRRAWNHFDYHIKLWGESEVQERIRDVLCNEKLFKKREEIFWKTYRNSEPISWWDYQWSFARLSQSGLSIVPSVNLISNIGFGEDSTHTKSTQSKVADLRRLALKFPIKFNGFLAVDRDYDEKAFEDLSSFGKINRLKTQISEKVKKMLNF